MESPVLSVNEPVKKEPAAAASTAPQGTEETADAPKPKRESAPPPNQSCPPEQVLAGDGDAASVADTSVNSDMAFVEKAIKKPSASSDRGSVASK